MSSIRYGMMPRANNFTVFLLHSVWNLFSTLTGLTRRRRNRENLCLVGNRVCQLRSVPGLSLVYAMHIGKMTWNYQGICQLGTLRCLPHHSTYMYIQHWCFLFLDSVTVAGAVGWFSNGSKTISCQVIHTFSSLSEKCVWKLAQFGKKILVSTQCNLAYDEPRYLRHAD